MFEPGQPWYVMTAPECEAAGYGLMEGLKFWKRRVTPYDEIDKLPLSPQWKQSLKDEYHYYRTCFEIPETVALVALVIWYASTNYPALMTLAGTYFGVIL